MTPSLALRGRLIALTGCALVAVGTLHDDTWPLVALGTVILSALMTAYLAFFPVAIFLRRHKIELAWWVPPGDQPGGALSPSHPFSLHASLRNRGRWPLRVRALSVFASSALEPPMPGQAIVPPGAEVELVLPMRARACGYWVLHGATMRLGDLLGLFELTAYFPNPISVKVFPQISAPRQNQAIRPQIGALHERVGVHSIRRRGLAGDLREIRDHAAGDPFKMIAWKATARRRRLMVRELESEIVVTHQLLVDMSATMRRGEPGLTKLDWAIETASALARAALEGGDRVGALTFDARVYGQVKPGEGRPHFLKIVDRFLDTKGVVDEDLTDLTDGELVAAIARYARHQEGLDVRIARAPKLDDPAWARLAAGPHGELFDAAALVQLARTVVADAERPRKGRRPLRAASEPVPPGAAKPSDLSRLRDLCRVRGIELPYRQSYEPGRRSAGLAEALRRATHSERSQFVVILTDLEGVQDEPASVVAALRLARRRHHHLLALVPYGPSFVRPAATDAGQRVAEVLEAGERRRLDAARQLVVRAGVPVIVTGPDDTPLVLARRMARSVRRA